MADTPVLHIGENSPEHVAYRLFHHIAQVEGKILSQGNSAPDRKWILDTYAECLRAVKTPTSRVPQKP